MHHTPHAKTTAQEKPYKNQNHYIMRNNTTHKQMPAVARAAMRQLCLAVALLAAAFAPGHAMAEETVQQYALKLRDVQVTSENCSDIQFSQHRGKASYDPATKTLTLDNLYASDQNVPVIHNMGIDGLTIKCKGDITMYQDGGVLLEANTTIEGSEADPSSFTYLHIGKGTKVTVANFLKLTVSLYGTAVSGVTGTDGETLVIKNSNFATYGKIEKLAAFETDECDIGDGAAFDASLHAVATDGEAASRVNVYKREAYDLWIAGVQVTSTNFDKLSQIPGVSGNIYYEKGECMLYLGNCSITPEPGVPAIRSDIEEFSIALEGNSESTLTANGAPAMILGKETYMQTNAAMYNGKLTATASGGYPAILAHDVLEIYRMDLDASGKYGIEGADDGVCLNLSEANVKLSGSTSATANITELNTARVKITSPEGAAYDSSLRGVAKDGKLAAEVTFAELEDYMLEIGSYYVDETNCADLSVLPCINGNASYDRATNTLTLDNASVDGCIYTGTKDDFTLLVKGKCSLKGDFSLHALTVYDDGNTTIRGEEGSELRIEMPDTSPHTSYTVYLASYNDDATLTIDNCTLDITGDVPIMRVSTDNDASTLRIKNSTLYLHATFEPVFGFKTAELQGSIIESPEGMHYQGKAFVNENGITYEGDMTIVRDTTNGIGAASTDDSAEKPVYTVGGTRIAHNGGKLPKGIYITGGKKKVVR